jgi:pimeloyl-ACP methyl ester carboxylesterase
MRRLLRVALVLLGAVFVVLTIAAIAIDVSPIGASKPAQRLYQGPYVRIGRTLVAYREWGSGGTPIVLLGGAAEPSWVWHAVAPRLAAAGHRVFALDLPPFGYTQRNVQPSMRGWLALLHGFEQRLGITRPLLVGHSLGAAVAAGEALTRPRAVAGIVLLDGDARPFGGGRSWLPHLLVYPWTDAAYRLLTGSDWVVGHVLRSAWGPQPPSFPHATLAQFERPFRVAGTLGELRTLMGRGLPGVSLEELGRIRIRRAVVWGSADTVDSISSGRATAAALGVPLERIPGAGHLSMLSRPSRVAELILKTERQRPQRSVPRLRHVVVVVFENREAAQIAGSSEAPNFNRFAHAYADLTAYTAVAHPSLPNYLALVSGSTHGITDDCTTCTVPGPSLGSLLSAAKRSWGGYAQGYPSSPLFAKKHMPFLYFPGQEAHVHPLTSLNPARLPAFAFVAPNLCDDAHDCPLGAADRFLGRFLPPLLHAPGTAVFVVFDEGTSGEGGGGHVFAFAAGTAVRRHVNDSTPTNHYGLLRTIEAAFALRPLGRSAGEPPIDGIWR